MNWFADKNGLIDVRHARPLPPPARWPSWPPFSPYQTLPACAIFCPHAARAVQRPRPHGQPPCATTPANRATFIRILQEPSGIMRAPAGLMNATSVLGRYLWSFRRIVGKMQHDLFHVYTVDQHSLMVLRNMRRFFMPEFAHEYPLCSELASQLGPAVAAVSGRPVSRHRQRPGRRPQRHGRD